MTDAPKFTQSRRGYQTADVDRAIEQMASRIDSAVAEREAADKAVKRLNRELREARAALKRLVSKPSFSDLGAAFEQTLRVAEEQAGKLLIDATAEVASMREAAKEYADRLITSAKKHGAKLESDAKSRSNEISNQAKKRAKEIVADAEARLVASREALEQSRQEASQIEANGEQAAIEILAAVNKETEVARAELDKLREINDREQKRVLREIEAVKEKSDREAQRLSEQTSAYIIQISAESEIQVAETDARGHELLSEAEAFLARSREEGNAQVASARATAVGVIARANERAQSLANQLRAHAETVRQETLERLAELDGDRAALRDFVDELSGTISRPDDAPDPRLFSDIPESYSA